MAMELAGLAFLIMTLGIIRRRVLTRRYCELLPEGMVPHGKMRAKVISCRPVSKVIKRPEATGLCWRVASDRGPYLML